MKMSEIFERAAEVVDSMYMGGCCGALSHVDDSDNAHYNYFKLLFKPRNVSEEGFWFATGGVAQFPESRAPRVLALLFAAAIARSEGK